ncbi:MAG TPA: DUF4383 domain-containing protein [Micromonosporaceae bacterium]
MSHHPVNHPARPTYRALAGFIGLYLVIFGGLAAAKTAGGDIFAQDDTRVLWQGVNFASAVLFGALGVLVLAGVGLGRNIDVLINKWLGGWFLIALGLGSLALQATDVNYLNFDPITCFVSMVLGLLLLAAGMYGKVGSEEDVEAWQRARLVL